MLKTELLIAKEVMEHSEKHWLGGFESESINYFQKFSSVRRFLPSFLLEYFQYGEL